MRSGRAVAVSALLALAAVNVLAACTPQDDSDIFPTPTPSTPEPDFRCQIVWASQNTQLASQFDVFVIDAPEVAWVGGVNTFGEFTAYYQPGLDVTGNSFPMTLLDTRGGVVTSTAGAFEIVLGINQTDDDADVEIASLTTAELLVIGTDGEIAEETRGRVDAFAFEGVWTARDAQTLELGTGTAELMLGTGTNGTLIELGDSGAFAFCYEADGGAAITAAQKSLTVRRR